MKHMMLFVHEKLPTRAVTQVYRARVISSAEPQLLRVELDKIAVAGEF